MSRQPSAHAERGLPISLSNGPRLSSAGGFTMPGVPLFPSLLVSSPWILFSSPQESSSADAATPINKYLNLVIYLSSFLLCNHWTEKETCCAVICISHRSKCSIIQLYRATCHNTIFSLEFCMEVRSIVSQHVRYGL